MSSVVAAAAQRQLWVPGDCPWGAAAGPRGATGCQACAGTLCPALESRALAHAQGRGQPPLKRSALEGAKGQPIPAWTTCPAALGELQLKRPPEHSARNGDRSSRSRAGQARSSRGLPRNWRRTPLGMPRPHEGTRLPAPSELLTCQRGPGQRASSEKQPCPPGRGCLITVHRHHPT